MSSPEPRRAQQRRRLPAPATPAACGGGDAGALPLDALCEILLRLPGKQLCRLRTVCRAWRSLLSAPWFAAAHAARRPEPYIVASYADDVDLDRDSLVDVLDMSSGQIVRHVAAGNASDMVVSVAAPGLVCVKTINSGSFRLLDPVTGAVHNLSDRLAPEHAARGFSLRDYGEPVHLFGQVAGTCELKVLRMLPFRQRHDGSGSDRDDLFEVCTFSSSARWRGMQGPPRSFVWNEWTRVVVGGVVYCLSVAAYFAVVNRRADEQGWIVRFDLEAEEWRPRIKGPSDLVGGGGRHNLYLKQVTLANLNGSLVIVHGSSRVMDLWFLKDSEEGLWVKQYSVQIERSGHLSPMHPLLVLEDGRIVTVIRSMGLLQIYDPRTSTFASLMMLRHSSRVSVHAGSLLSLHSEN
ncbi:F-box protein At3g07870-like [Miscanthus floridulus]|uniref:F-box protein At3g07870-like n=1 Tax=Miscanthus floridulus TaxID=154761 RepID=UPI003458C967